LPWLAEIAAGRIFDYLTIRRGSAGRTAILLLCGGDKRKQDRDIAKAKKLAGEWKE
jgi:putative component of toxin-antitoxin plasmid stabilization module